MSELRINEQISFLRKQKELTQEELAQALGVTNQAVSKWESGVCCPDIQLLPDIASYFGVSVDELLGYSAKEDIESLLLKIKDFFKSTPRDKAFSAAFRLAVMAHRGIWFSNCGYDFDKISEPDVEKFKHGRGRSICSEPEGTTMYCGNGAFIADQKYWNPMSRTEIEQLYGVLNGICDINILKVMYTVFELTIGDFDDLYVSVAEVSKKCHMSTDGVRNILDRLPLRIKKGDNGEELYRLDGSFMNVPSFLRMLI